MSTRRNFTVEDTSPLIQYTVAANWVAGNSPANGDALKSNYSMGTFMVTQASGSNASFSFNGTGVWIYGAKRGNHGPYVGTIDSVSLPQQNGSSPTDLLQQVLYGAADLTQGPHTVTITSEAADYLDVDYIVYESTVADDSTVIFDDTHPQVQYSPPGAWITNGCPNIGTYFGSSCHTSLASSASVQLSFQGDSITVYGGVGYEYGPYSVVLDSRPPAEYTALGATNIAPVILYSAVSLGPGNHTVTLTKSPSSSGQSFDVDYFLVAGNATTGSTGTYLPQPTDLGQESPNVGIIVGAAVGTVVAVCSLMFALLWFFILRHRQSKRRASLDVDGGWETHIQYLDTPTTPHVEKTSGSTSDLHPTTMGMPQVISANAIGQPIMSFSELTTFPDQREPGSPSSGLLRGPVARYAHQSPTSPSGTYTSRRQREGSSGLGSVNVAHISAVGGKKGSLGRSMVLANSDAGSSVQRLTSPGAESHFTDAPPLYS